MIVVEIKFGNVFMWLVFIIKSLYVVYEKWCVLFWYSIVVFLVLVCLWFDLVRFWKVFLSFKYSDFFMVES